MAKQEVVYKTVGDTGERDDLDAIAPITSGERVGQVVLRRPDENLRVRTEVDRTELEAQKYLQDSDMRWVITGGDAAGVEAGSGIPYVTWDPVTGKFTISDQIVVQPLTTPDTDVQQVESYSFLLPVVGGLDFTPVGGVGGMRSYNGANRLEIVWLDAAAPTGGAEIAVSGDPLHIITITVRTDGTTTVGQVDAALLAAPVAADLITAGIGYIVTGNPAAQVNLPLPADVIFSGNFERELHVIPVAVLAAFFGAESLTDGDTLAIWYDELIDPAGTTGRRQSITSNVNTTLIAGQLTNLTTHPERIPLAIPLCKRIGDDLLFIDGTVVAGALTTSPQDTYFGVHGYMMDMFLTGGGGPFNDAAYFAWLGVNAATFQVAWDSFIPLMDTPNGATYLGYDNAPVFNALGWGAPTYLQGAIDDLLTALDFPGAALTTPCGSSKIGFDGITLPGAITLVPFDVWVGMFSPDVWNALLNLMDAYYDDALCITTTGVSGASRIGYDDTIFNPWVGSATRDIQAALDTLAVALAAITGDTLIGADAIAGVPTNLPAGSVQTQTALLLAAVNARARIASFEYITGEWQFHGNYDFDTSAQVATYPQHAEISTRLASPGEGWYDESYGNPASTGVSSDNYYPFSDPVVDTLVFWDPINNKKMFIFLVANAVPPDTIEFHFGDAVTGILDPGGPFTDDTPNSLPLAFCASDTGYIYVYTANGEIWAYIWDGATFVGAGLAIYTLPGVLAPPTTIPGSAKILYSSAHNAIVVPTNGVGAQNSGGIAAIHVIDDAGGGLLFDTDCNCVGGNFTGGLEQNGQKIWATFDGAPGRIGEADFTGLANPPTAAYQIFSGAGTYEVFDLLYDGYRLWYHCHDITGAGHDFIGYHVVGTGVGAWVAAKYDDAYTYGVQIPLVGCPRLGFDGFNLWFYSPTSAAGDPQLALQKVPVASAPTVGPGAPISLLSLTERWEVSRGVWAATYSYGRMFFDGFTLWLAPEYGGLWGNRIPWAVIR